MTYLSYCKIKHLIPFKGGTFMPGYGYGAGFSLIVVLFILLIIVGASEVGHGHKY
jgi:uncharacterized protein (TIGR01732 family)